MKALIYILSLYILVLASMPCADLPNGNKMLNAEFSQQTTNTTSQQSESDTCDHCSPFCVCSCCVSTIAHQLYSINFTCYSFSPIQLCNHLCGEALFNNTSIWQPPQLS